VNETKNSRKEKTKNKKRHNCHKMNQQLYDADKNTIIPKRPRY